MEESLRGGKQGCGVPGLPERAPDGPRVVHAPWDAGAGRAPEDCACFEAELRITLARAADDLDLSVVETVLTRWHALATMAVNPLTAAERAQVERAKASDFTGLYTRDEQRNWIQL